MSASYSTSLHRSISASTACSAARIARYTRPRQICHPKPLLGPKYALSTCFKPVPGVHQGPSFRPITENFWRCCCHDKMPRNRLSLDRFYVHNSRLTDGLGEGISTHEGRVPWIISQDRPECV